MLLITVGQLGLTSHPCSVGPYREALEKAVERARKHGRTMYVVFQWHGVTGYDVVLYDGVALVSSLTLQPTAYGERDVVAVVLADGRVNVVKDQDSFTGGTVVQHC